MSENDFETAIYPHLNAAYNLARWLLRSDQDAQDVVHDSFLRAHRYFKSFDGSDGKAWLLGIVRNACFTWMRTKRAEPLPHEDAIEFCSPISNSPERMVLLSEDLDALHGCIDALPAEYKTVVILRELEELSYKEIAAAAGLALGTVMSRLNRARTRLEDCLLGKTLTGKTKEARA